MNVNGLARLQRLSVKDMLFESESNYYCGIKFTVPPWLDGDLEFMYASANNEAEKDFTAEPMESNIISETDDTAAFHDFEVENLADCPQFQQQLPYTKKTLIGHLDMNNLNPGKTYGIWFGFNETNFPDIAFAITIESQRRSTEFGEFPSFIMSPPG
jgi:hypothetical protein